MTARIIPAGIQPEVSTCEITIYAVPFGIVATYFWESMIARKVFLVPRSKQVDYIRQYSWRNSNVENASFDCAAETQSASNFWYRCTSWVRISRKAIASNYLLIYWRTQKIGIKSHQNFRGCVKCSSKCKSNNIGSLCNSVVFVPFYILAHDFWVFREIFYSVT